MCYFHSTETLNKHNCYSPYTVDGFIVKKKEVKIPKSTGLPATHIKNIVVLRCKWTSKKEHSTIWNCNIHELLREQ